MISWAKPEHLALLWLVPAMALLFGFLASHRYRQRGRLAEKDILPQVVVGRSRSLEIARIALASLAMASLILAVSRPQWGEELVPARTQGADVVLVLDASLSMLARDVPPDRLGLARRELRRLIDSLGPCRISLVAFAGSAIRQIPLTEDRGALATVLDAISPDMLPYAGTDIGTALGAAQNALARSRAKHRVVVLVTDGGDFGKRTQDAAKAITDGGADFWVVGAGGDQAVPIPLPQGGTKQDREGNIVTVKLERAGLEDLARASNGRYIELSATKWALDPILARINAVVLEAGVAGMRLERVDRFPLFIGISIALLFAELALPHGRRRK